MSKLIYQKTYIKYKYIIYNKSKKEMHERVIKNYPELLNIIIPNM